MKFKSCKLCAVCLSAVNFSVVKCVFLYLKMDQTSLVVSLHPDMRKKLKYSVIIIAAE